jgi:acyl dehydratase
VIRYYDDIEPGQHVESLWYRVTREAIMDFGREWDPYPFHVDEEAAQKTHFGGIVACTAHIFSIQSILTHKLPEDVALVSGLGGDGMNLLLPVRPDDDVRLVRTFTSKRESGSRPSCGVVGIDHTLERKNGDRVFRTTGAILVERQKSESRPHEAFLG